MIVPVCQRRVCMNGECYFGAGDSLNGAIAGGDVFGIKLG